MIAIAGVKGGCGKTTTTLGLAEAFARAGTPTLAVDADRQLPNLHVAADVDREPTVAAVDAGTDITALAQGTPRSPDVGVLPAPKASDRIDIRDTLERFDHGAGQVLVDCPSGAGPDAVEPIAAADRAVVVTTDTERSVDAALTTVEMARRLEVPVAGVVVTRSTRVPDGIGAADVPVLCRVPEADTPLSAGPVRTAYDRAVADLASESVDATTAERDRRSRIREGERLTTGIGVVDRELGGLPAGSVVALTADSDSQSEVFLYEMTSSRGTLYLSTETVRHTIEASMADAGNPTIRHLDGDDPLAQAEALIRKLPQGANLIVDTMDDLEGLDRDAYLAFQNTLVEHVRSTGSIALLHCLKGPDEPENRSSTEHFADAVFDLRTSVEGEDLKHNLAIPKSRRESAPTKTLELDLSDPISKGRTRDPA